MEKCQEFLREATSGVGVFVLLKLSFTLIASEARLLPGYARLSKPLSFTSPITFMACLLASVLHWSDSLIQQHTLRTHWRHLAISSYRFLHARMQFSSQLYINRSLVGHSSHHAADVCYPLALVPRYISHMCKLPFVGIKVTDKGHD